MKKLDERKTCKHCKKFKLLAHFAYDMKGQRGHSDACIACEIIVPKAKKREYQKQWKERRFILDMACILFYAPGPKSEFLTCRKCGNYKPRMHFSDDKSRITLKFHTCRNCRFGG